MVFLREAKRFEGFTYPTTNVAYLLCWTIIRSIHRRPGSYSRAADNVFMGRNSVVNKNTFAQKYAFILSYIAAGYLRDHT